MNLESHIEAILFWKGEPISLKKISTILEKTPEEIEQGLKTLEKNLSGRGITLMRKDDEITLGTSPEVSNLIETLTKDELMRDLGKAGLETLSIVLYRGPIARREIDYIRGVNSNFILRNLLVRGLVEKIENEKDKRGFLYRPTFDLLSHLGITDIKKLPEYETVLKEMEKSFEAREELDETKEVINE